MPCVDAATEGLISAAAYAADEWGALPVAARVAVLDAAPEVAAALDAVLAGRGALVLAHRARAALDGAGAGA